MDWIHRNKGLGIELLVLGIVLLLAVASLLQARSIDDPLLTLTQPQFTTTSTNLTNYDSAYYGLPDVIAGYRVLLVKTEENTLCLAPKGAKVIVLQSPQPNVNAFLASGDSTAVSQELEALGKSAKDQWSLQIVGPGISREQIITSIEEMNVFWKNGCATNALPFDRKPENPS